MQNNYVELAFLLTCHLWLLQ